MRSALLLCPGKATFAGMRKALALPTLLAFPALLVLSGCGTETTPTAQRMTQDEARALSDAADMAASRKEPAAPVTGAAPPRP